jgi:hypothetical protein
MANGQKYIHDKILDRNGKILKEMISRFDLRKEKKLLRLNDISNDNNTSDYHSILSARNQFFRMEKRSRIS